MILKKIREYSLLQRLAIALFVLITSSCSGQVSEKKGSQVTNHDEHAKLEVELNKGERWQANAETTEGIENMISILNELTNSVEVSEYNQLATELEKEFTGIFKKCTMKGEAHNQLHNYLIPLKDYIKALQGNDLKKCRDSYSELKIHLAAYSDYFK